MSIKFNLTAEESSFEVDIQKQLNYTHREFTAEFVPAGGDVPTVALFRKLDKDENYVPIVTDAITFPSAVLTTSVGGIGLEELGRVGFVKFIINGANDPATKVRIVFTSN